jgi:WD40 repeat protein
MTASSVSPFPAPGLVVFGDPKLHTEGDLLALTFAADGNLWSVEEPGMVRRWDGTTGCQLEGCSVSDLEMLWQFSPDARSLASASDDVALWDPVTGEVSAAFAATSWVTALAFSRDSRMLATGHDDGAVRCWEVPTRRLVREFQCREEAVSALAFSPDGSRLAAAGEDRVIDLWDWTQAKLAGNLTGHTDRIPALAWHPDGRHLVSAGWDNAAWVWDTKTGQPVFILNPHISQVTALAFASTGEQLATGDAAGMVYVWEFAARKVRHVLKGDDQDIRCLAFSPDGCRLAAGSASRVIQLWDARSGLVLFGSDIPGSFPTRIALSPNGKRLVSTGRRTLRLWDTGDAQGPEGEKSAGARILHPGEAHTVAYSPDGRSIATGGDDYVIRIWDAQTGARTKTLEGQDGPVTSLVFAPDGNTLASASSQGGGVWVWDVGTGEPLLLVPDALDGCTVQSLAFLPGGKLLAAGGIDWLATGGSDGAACVWDLVERCEVATFAGGTTCLAVHPSGRWLSAASLVRSICLWDLSTHELVTEVIGPEDTVNALAFSPDGRWLACGGDDRILRLWPMEEDQVIADALVEVPLDTQINSLCFAPDSRFLYTGNGNTTCYRLNLASQDRRVT